MKRAKIMLMAIAIIAVVGGALAFKASKFTNHPFFACGTNAAGVTGCYSPFLSKAIPVVQGLTNFPYLTVSAPATCTPVAGRTIPCSTTALITVIPDSGE